MPEDRPPFLNDPVRLARIGTVFARALARKEARERAEREAAELPEAA